MTADPALETTRDTQPAVRRPIVMRVKGCRMDSCLMP